MLRVLYGNIPEVAFGHPSFRNECRQILSGCCHIRFDFQLRVLAFSSSMYAAETKYDCHDNSFRNIGGDGGEMAEGFKLFSLRSGGGLTSIVSCLDRRVDLSICLQLSHPCNIGCEREDATFATSNETCQASNYRAGYPFINECIRTAVIFSYCQKDSVAKPTRMTFFFFLRSSRPSLDMAPTDSKPGNGAIPAVTEHRYNPRISKVHVENSPWIHLKEAKYPRTIKIFKTLKFTY